MKAVLKLERFGDHGRYRAYMGRDKSQPWVARLLGLSDEWGFKREFIHGQTDYSNASGTGARGVYIYYPLDNGIYEVNRRTSWKNTKRYFIRVEDATITEITREEVLQCLTTTSDTSGSAS